MIPALLAKKTNRDCSVDPHNRSPLQYLSLYQMYHTTSNETLVHNLKVTFKICSNTRPSKILLILFFLVC